MIRTYAAACGYDVPAVPINKLGQWNAFYDHVDPAAQGFAHAGLSLLAEALRLSETASDLDPFRLEPLVADVEKPYHWAVNPALAERAKPTATTQAERPAWNCADHGDVMEASLALMSAATAITTLLKAFDEPEYVFTIPEGDHKVSSAVYGLDLPAPGLRYWAGQQLGSCDVTTMSICTQRDLCVPDDAPAGTEPSWGLPHTLQFAAGLASAEYSTLFGTLRAMVDGSEIYIHGSAGVCERTERFGFAQDRPLRVVSALAAITRRLCTEIP
jgi:hypothetical protein